MKIIEVCPICGGSECRKVLEVTDHFASGELFPVYDCGNCGFRFTNHFPSEDAIERYYHAADYISHSDSDKGLMNKLYRRFRRLMLHRKVRLVTAFTRNGEKKLLDIGCGTGYFLHAARENGFAVCGIEKDPATRETASQHFALDIKGDLFEMGEGPFDVITLWHVLEHLEKLNESIDKIGELLSPDGTLFIAVPNHHSYDARRYREQWAAYDIPRHLWHFTPETMERLLTKHGLKIIGTRAMPLDAFYIALLSEKYLGRPACLRYAKACMTGVGGFFRSLRNIEASSSIIYIVKHAERAS